MEMSVVFSLVQGSNYRSMEDENACSYQVCSRDAVIDQCKMDISKILRLGAGM